MSPLSWILCGIAVFVVLTFLYNSPVAVRARLNKWKRRFRSELEQIPTEDLKRRILESDYFQLRADRSIRDAETVQRFLAQLEAGDPNVSLDGFVEAERSIGYRDRPMILDYGGTFTMILDELKTRNDHLDGAK